MVCQAEVHLLNFDEAVWVGGVRCFPTRLDIRFANSSANHSNALRDFIISFHGYSISFPLRNKRVFRFY